MQKRNIRQFVLPLIAAFIWGNSFVAQSLGTGHLEAFTFNMCRSVVAVAVLGALILFLKQRRGDGRSAAEKETERRTLLLGGTCCGFFLTLGISFQQIGLKETAAGKAGFITALYVVLVPVVGLFFRKRVAAKLWVSVLLALGGLYYLCMDGTNGFTLERGDFFVLLCAFAFTGQVLCIDYFVRRVDEIKLSFAQFCFVALASALLTLAFETPTVSAIIECLPYILYVGIFASGVAYTLQFIAQKDGDPTVVSLLMSMESFFAVLSGAVLLNERLTGREYLGCALMLAAVFLSQLPEKRRKSVESENRI